MPCLATLPAWPIFKLKAFRFELKQKQLFPEVFPERNRIEELLSLCAMKAPGNVGPLDRRGTGFLFLPVREVSGRCCCIFATALNAPSPSNSRGEHLGLGENLGHLSVLCQKTGLAGILVETQSA